ncbi:fumarylacetoacetate hydrolase family protein [Lentisphaerota bacterium WC36G]|nr:fumarylacetoacetate hydrolase family protein [Lentisphaerae bacterium WC36]
MKVNYQGQSVEVPRVFCIGRNYVAHAHELGDDVPDNPIIFSKFSTSLVTNEIKEIKYPSFGDELHYETELVVLIGKEGNAESEDEAQGFIEAVSLGFDLTMRDVQNKLMANGLPWEVAKGFDNSALIGDFVSARNLDLSKFEYTGLINDKVCQEGDTQLMIFSITQLIYELSKVWKLRIGDLIYTGTPAGVGEVRRGDKLTAKAKEIGEFSWNIV